MGTGECRAFMGSGSFKESKCRACGFIPGRSLPCTSHTAWLGCCLGCTSGSVWELCSLHHFMQEIPVSASTMNPAVPWCFVSLSKHRHLWCLFYTCAFIVTLREEELDRRNAMSRIPWKHSLFPLPCALFGFHHKSAILRLLVGLRLICCLSFPLQCTPRAA